LLQLLDTSIDVVHPLCSLIGGSCIHVERPTLRPNGPPVYLSGTLIVFYLLYADPFQWNDSLLVIPFLVDEDGPINQNVIEQEEVSLDKLSPLGAFVEDSLPYQDATLL